MKGWSPSPNLHPPTQTSWAAPPPALQRLCLRNPSFSNDHSQTEPL